MAEIRRVAYHGLEIVVKSQKVRLQADHSIVTRFYAVICNWGDVVLYRTDPTASPEEAIEAAKAFIKKRS